MCNGWSIIPAVSLILHLRRHGHATVVPNIKQTVPFAAAGVLTETCGKLQALVYDILPPEEGCWEAGIEFSVASKTVGS